MAQWFRLWVIPRVGGYSVPGAQWVDLGWLHMSLWQLEVLKTMLECCSAAFDDFAVMTQDGSQYFRRQCPQQGY